MSYTLNLETDEEAKEMQKAALILEGGAKRGVFTSGVLDYLMEKDIERYRALIAKLGIRK